MNLFEILPEEIAALKLEATADKNKNIIGKLRYNFVMGDKKNGNGRTYPADLVKREIAKMTRKLESQRIPGTLDHPKGVATELEKISHIITSVSYDENYKMGVAESAILNTGKGRDLKILIQNGVRLGASIRGTGTMDGLGKVNPDWQLGSIDLVANPSFGEDVAVNSKNLIESGNQALQQVMTEDEKLFARWEFALDSGCKLSLAEYKEKMKVLNEETSEKGALNEEFFSLDSALRSAVDREFGNKNYIVDFSDSEVIFRNAEEQPEGDYFKVGYKIVKNDVELDIATKKAVQKSVDFEGILAQKMKDFKRAHDNAALAEIKK